MLKSIRGLAAATLLAGTALAATPAFADDTAAPSEFTITGSVQGVTDYRFRGLSQTFGDPAIQGSIGVNHASGFYVGAWASSIDNGLGSTELDVYGGWTGEVTPGITADAGLLYYVYPGAHGIDANYFEPYASVSTNVGPVSAKVGVNYAWDQDALGNDDNLYVYGELGAGIPNTPISLSAHLGYADGVQSPKYVTSLIAAALAADPTLVDNSGGFDYSVGATFNITPKLSLGVSYVGVDGYSFDDFSDDSVVGTLKLSF